MLCLFSQVLGNILNASGDMSSDDKDALVTCPLSRMALMRAQAARLQAAAPAAAADSEEAAVV